MTKDQAKAFLTPSDLKKLEGLIEAGKLQSAVTPQNVEPVVQYRGQQIPMFVILELLGSQ